MAVLLLFLLESQHVLYFVFCSGHLRNTCLGKKTFLSSSQIQKQVFRFKEYKGTFVVKGILRRR